MLAQLPARLHRDLGDHQDVTKGCEVVEGEASSEQGQAVQHQGAELPREAHVVLAHQRLLQEPREV